MRDHMAEEREIDRMVQEALGAARDGHRALAVAPILAYLDKIGDQFGDDCPLCTNPRDGEGNPIVAEPGDITVGDLRKVAAAMAVIS